MENKSIICQDCGEEFVFMVGEQEFYQEKGLIMSLKDVVNVEQRENIPENQEKVVSNIFKQIEDPDRDLF